MAFLCFSAGYTKKAGMICDKKGKTANENREFELWSSQETKESYLAKNRQRCL